MNEVKRALLAAADWLERHPDRHIRGWIAVASDGRYTDPTSNYAVAFCGVGRIAHELGHREFSGDYHRRLDQAIPWDSPTAKPSALLVGTNDFGKIEFRRMVNTRVPQQPGNPEVIPLMRKMAERIADDD